MTPDQLRALADALSRQRQADEHGIYCAVPRQAVDAAIKYLRAQADAQPVAAVPAGWKWVPVEPTPEMLRASDSVTNPNRIGWYDADIARAEYRAMLAAAPAVPQADALPVALVRAYNAGYMAGHHDTVEGGFVDIHPSDMDTYHADVVAELGLPAAPQAEPCIGNNPTCPCQDGDACHYRDAADGTKGWPVPQAEPKREPLSDEQMTRAAQDVLAERRRQIEAEGWTPEHDDKHGSGEMAAAAATYALHTIGLYHDCTVDLPPDPWPWAFDWWKPGDRRRNLVKAGALILAEIERLDRMGGSDAE